MRALIIDEPWITDILEGRKTMEIRKRSVNLRGRIGLVRKGSGKVVGTALLKDCKGPMTAEEAARIQGHTSTREGLQAYASKKPLYVWELEKVKQLAQPIAYKHKHGAVVWTKLSAREEQGVLKNSREESKQQHAQRRDASA